MFGSICSWRSESVGIHSMLEESSSTNEKFFVLESEGKHKLRANDKNRCYGRVTSNRTKV
jgi:hypothetical protein